MNEVDNQICDLRHPTLEPCSIVKINVSRCEECSVNLLINDDLKKSLTELPGKEIKI